MSYKELLKNSLFENSPMVVFVWSNKNSWIIEGTTNNSEKIFGYEQNYFLNNTVTYIELIHCDDIATVEQEITQLTNTDINNIIHKPYRIRDKFNNYKWVQTTTTIQKNEIGEITHFIGYVQDITNQILEKKN